MYRLIRALSHLLLVFSFDVHALTVPEANTQLQHANMLFAAGSISEALTVYRQLLSHFPQSCALMLNAARAAYELNNNTLAISLLEQALEQQPDHPEIRYQYAISQLTAGNYALGWKQYESRWKKHDKQQIRFAYPQWHGESIVGKRILLVSEGDYGDIFQFVRLAQVLKTTDTHLTLYTKKELIPLMQQLPYLDIVTATLPAPDAIDYWASLMSIPAYIDMEATLAMQTIPYLHADHQAITRCASYIQPTTYNVGICWDADAANDANRPPLAQRSIPPHLFELFALPGVALYPLTKQYYAPDFDCTHGSFTDSAGLVSQLDLVITVDTAIAHLAGALGKKTWILLPYKADWRWMLERIDTPWYPTATLFRNNETNDWRSLCMQVAQELSLFLEER